MAMHQPELDFGPVTDFEVTLRRVGKRNPPSVQHLDKDISLPNLLGAEIA